MWRWFRCSTGQMIFRHSGQPHISFRWCSLLFKPLPFSPFPSKIKTHKHTLTWIGGSLYFRGCTSDTLAGCFFSFMFRFCFVLSLSSLLRVWAFLWINYQKKNICIRTKCHIGLYYQNKKNALYINDYEL